MEVLTIGQLAKRAGVGVETIRFYGFTLKEVQDLLELRVDPSSSCADVRSRAREKITDIEARIASLERMKGALERLAKKCRGRGPTSDCPILEELDREEDGDAECQTND